MSRTQVVPAHGSGNGQVSLEVYGQENQPSVQVEGWTTTQESQEEGPDPALLYARVSLARLPVAGAVVFAAVTTSSGDVRRIRLTDDGSGYPDVTANDGVYSAHFTGFGSEGGLYAVAFEASDADGRAAVPRTNFGGTASRDGADCCGSVQQPSFQPTGSAFFHTGFLFKY